MVAATELRKALPTRHRVVLVERESSSVFAPSLLWLMTGSRPAEQISRPMTRLEKNGVEVVRGEIERIDPGKREIVVSGRTLTGDYLIVALGAELAPEAVSQAVRQMVEAKGIAYHPEHQIQEVAGSGPRLKCMNGAGASFDLLAYVPAHRAPKVVRESGLVGESGWVSVDRHTLETQYDGVYALGDVVAIPLKLGKPLPKAGVFAHAEADVVARNIVRSITGKGKPASFDGAGGCFIETGDGKAGLGKGNFYAEPVPEVKIHPPGRHWHFAKVLFEKRWLKRWF